MRVRKRVQFDLPSEASAASTTTTTTVGRHVDAWPRSLSPPPPPSSIYRREYRRSPWPPLAAAATATIDAYRRLDELAADAAALKNSSFSCQLSPTHAYRYRARSADAVADFGGAAATPIAAVTSTSSRKPPTLIFIPPQPRSKVDALMVSEQNKIKHFARKVKSINCKLSSKLRLLWKQLFFLSFFSCSCCGLLVRECRRRRGLLSVASARTRLLRARALARCRRAGPNEDALEHNKNFAHRSARSSKISSSGGHWRPRQQQKPSKILVRLAH